jgi:hypothetical protein
MTLHSVDRTYVTNWESRISAKVLLHMELENKALIVEQQTLEGVHGSFQIR